MGRKQTVVEGFAGGPTDGSEWSRAYRLEWGEVVGHRIRRLRQARGWALKDVAARVAKPEGGRYSLGYFSRLERGWTSPPLYVYVAIARAFGVQPGDLLGVEELDREFNAEQRMLLRLVEELGLAPHEAAARLVAGSAARHESASNVS
jgi:transcriptional regulator with XRE-family HTH domain